MMSGTQVNNRALHPAAEQERAALAEEFPEASEYIDGFLRFTGGLPTAGAFEPQEFKPYTFAVAKVSGSIATTPDVLKQFAADVASLSRLGLPLNIVHGAGGQIDQKLENAGFQSQKRSDGTRITPAEHMWAVDEAVTEVNAVICDAIIAEGAEVASAGSVFTATLADSHDRSSEHVIGVDTKAVEAASLAGKIVVVRCDGQAALPDGEIVPVNINADISGRALAVTLQVLKYIGLTKEPGILEKGVSQRNLTAAKAQQLITSGEIHGSAVVKVQQLIEVVRQGVRDTVVVNYGGLKDELFRPKGKGAAGTMIHA